jgi:hypothetical protein
MWNGPSVGTRVAVLMLEPVATISFVREVICARAAAVGDEMAVQWRSLTQCSDGGGASRRSQHDPRDRLGL